MSGRQPCAPTSAALLNLACCSRASAVSVRPLLGSSVAWGTGEGHGERTAPYSPPRPPQHDPGRARTSVGTSSCSARPMLPRGAWPPRRLPTAEDDARVPEGHTAHAEPHSGQVPGLQPGRLFHPMPFRNRGTVLLPPQRAVSRDPAGLRPRTPGGGRSSGVRAVGGTPRPHGSLCEHTRPVQGRAPQK